MNAVVLTVSDSAHKGTREDRSGPAVRDRLVAMGWETSVEVVPDERDMISRKIAELCDSAVDAIFTTGGTGVGPRDVTPEATRDIVEREIPGVGEWMRMEGMKKTPRAILSRGLAGVRGRTLVINLPGSPKGAVESFDAVADLLAHVIDLLNGRTEHPPESKLAPRR